MDTKYIERVKKQYQDPYGQLALEICEKDPMFWEQDERGCRRDLEYWVEKLNEY